LSSPRNSNTILGLIQSSLLFGFSVDNAYDMNCDGIADIIVGEPASSGVQLIGANVAGGSAYIFVGKADGTYQPAPAWSLGMNYTSALGVNVASLTGYSVAGVRKVSGSLNKVMTGAPGLTLDFGSGLLNLGSTVNTLFGLVAGNNGVGKSFVFDAQLCGSGSSQQSLPLNIINFDAAPYNGNKVLISWDVVTERNINSYTIERSTDGLTWEVFGVLPGNASSDKKEHFSLTDNHPYSGTSYYRVKQMDIDNSIYYTNIKSVSFGSQATARLQVTNPFHQTISFRLETTTGGKITTDLLDLTGKIIYHQESTIGSGINSININGLSSLANGLYFIRVTNGMQQYSAKLLKQ
jgi:hypothetical protein